MTNHKRIIICVGVITSLFAVNHALAHNNINDDQYREIQQQDAALIHSPQWATRVNCNTDPQALNKAISYSRWTIQPRRFTVSGACSGPVIIAQRNIEISNDAEQSGSIVLGTGVEAQEALRIANSTVVLKDFNIQVDSNTRAITVTQNSVATLQNITSNAKSSTSDVLYPFVITDNSTAYIAQFSKSGFAISGSSVAQFDADNEDNMVDVLDTSMARSNTANRFLAVQVSGNGYFLADNKTHIDSLMIWSKAAVDVNRESSVGQLQMGGQTLFAAYRNSSITGPYFLYGNVVFELEHSTASNWVKVNKPQSILVGNNATVNGTLYPSWTWAGQDGSEP
ncbi:hypothetical protein J8L98_22460 [Pseudoalteromonas sp. MMG013]|uniref:hypothetical protein n=1 Tax=Pseudoalteromonas sp. MMG013 TaxID=2822687 RepID=UPI001B39C398|nr:hypothetical protein [Pseudoalteromonas sp. MMG013]MBQ4864458.1 hypothetical protein [Pseudoalteromonas sp. MMG013]